MVLVMAISLLSIMLEAVCCAAGDSNSLVGLLQRSTSAEQRMQVLECLQRDSAVTRAKLAGDAECLRALEEWVLDLIEDRMSFHVLETLLKVHSLKAKHIMMINLAPICHCKEKAVATMQFNSKVIIVMRSNTIYAVLLLWVLSQATGQNV